jgi:putative sigma-54 modulation protein
MQVQMTASEFAMTPSLREFLEQCLRRAFAPARHKIAAIAIRLRDLNRPQGGRDMVCQVSVKIPGAPGVVVNEVQEDMHAAIELAVRRAAYRAIRLLTRQRLARSAATADGAAAGSAARITRIT